MNNNEKKLLKRIKELENAIKKHRKATNHEMCWENDEKLWEILNDKVKINHNPPEWCEFMKKCAEYRKSKDKKFEDKKTKKSNICPQCKLPEPEKCICGIV